MTTNIQIGLAYVLGKINDEEHKLVDLEKALGQDYANYTMTMHKGLNSYKTYVLYKHLGQNADSKKLVEITEEYKITQLIHIIEEVISYDMKK